MKSESMLAQIGSVDDKYIEELFYDDIYECTSVRRKAGRTVIAICLALALLSSIVLYCRRDSSDRKNDEIVCASTELNERGK